MRSFAALLCLLCLQSAAVSIHAAPSLSRTLSGCCTFGWLTAGIADLDGDQRTDLIVGAPGSGRVYVYSGATGDELFRFALAQSDLGFAVADAGDLDGDGKHDIIAGSASFGGGRGAVRVYSGATGAVLYALDGGAPGDFFGAEVTGLGDGDGDGRADFAISAQGTPSTVSVYSGATGAVIRDIAGTPGSRFGSAIAPVADYDGDGRADLMIGAVSDGPGRAYVHSLATGQRLATLTADSAGGNFGESFAGDAGDVNADGKRDWFVSAYGENGSNGAVYVYSGSDAARLFKVSGSGTEGLGPGRSAGDVNGDGHADLVIGSYFYSGAGVNQGGRATIFSGRDGSVLSRWNGTRAGGQFGFDAIPLGDLNGDNRIDFAIASAPAESVDIFFGDIDRGDVFADGFEFVGAWFEPRTSGQGMLVTAIPERRELFVAWFTYPDRVPGAPPATEPPQRWLTAQGGYDGNVAELQVFITRGGAFDAADGVASEPAGTLRLELVSCSRLNATYRLPESAINFGDSPTVFRTRTIPLQRITSAALCSDAPPGAGA